MTLALLDGDIVAYRASAAAQEDVDWGDGQQGPTVNTRSAINNALTIARTWLGLSRCEKAVLCFSDPTGGNFRKLLGLYKEGRGAKPVAYWRVKEALEEEYEIFEIPGLEADDVLGLLSTSPTFTDPVIVSIDKDLMTIPGLYLNPIKDKKPRRIREKAADLWWMTQTLTGDPTDGYKGCPGIGPKRAEGILAGLNLQKMWRAVRETYESKGLTEEDALLQARFARILRREDYDKDKRRVRLWHPNEEEVEWLALD